VVVSFVANIIATNPRQYSEFQSYVIETALEVNFSNYWIKKLQQSHFLHLLELIPPPYWLWSLSRCRCFPLTFIGCLFVKRANKIKLLKSTSLNFLTLCILG